MPASWLLTSVAKVVTAYTRPGHRVLLLEPAALLATAGLRMSNCDRKQSLLGPYAGLNEAAWTVFRLGRGVQTQSAVPHLEQVREHVGAEREGRPSGFINGPGTDELVSPTAQADSNPDSDPSDGPDRYDLVVTAAEPDVLGRLRPLDWSSVLTPRGILAVLTRGGRSGGRLIDPAGSLVRDAELAGLRYLDRIALLRTPVLDGTPVVVGSLGRSSSRASTSSVAPTVRHAQVHDDLLVFTKQRTVRSGVKADA